VLSSCRSVSACFLPACLPIYSHLPVRLPAVDRGDPAHWRAVLSSMSLPSLDCLPSHHPPACFPAPKLLFLFCSPAVDRRDLAHWRAVLSSMSLSEEQEAQLILLLQSHHKQARAPACVTACCARLSLPACLPVVPARRACLPACSASQADFTRAPRSAAKPYARLRAAFVAPLRLLPAHLLLLLLLPCRRSRLCGRRAPSWHSWQRR